MTVAPSEVVRVAALLVAGGLVLAGTGLGIFYGVLCLGRVVRLSLPARAELSRRPFADAHALTVVAVTLLLAVPALFQSPAPAGAEPPRASTVIQSHLVYAFACLAAVALCLSHTGLSPRAAFAPERCAPRKAAAKGLLWGLILIPPVIAVSMAATAALEALGFDAGAQEIFGLLDDKTVSAGTRLFVMASAAVVAPVTEEALFRGILFPALLKRRAFAASALLSGTYFALMHLHLPSLLPLLTLGLAFSAAYAATGSLVTPIVMHALFNGMSILLSLAAPKA